MLFATKKCVANLHDNSKSNMAAIVNKVYSLIAPDVTTSMLVEKTIAKKSFGNLNL